MNLMRLSLCSFVIFCIIFCNAQGVYTEFGQNRVQYKKFHWKAFEGENADLLYSDTQLNSVVSFADKSISNYLPQLETILGYKASNRPQFLIYGSLSDYKQNNIGYVNPQWQSGGITFIPAEALPVYFNGDYAAYNSMLLKGLSDFMLREMVYGGTLQDRFERLKSPALPYWFTEGLSSLIAGGWGSDEETTLRDAFSTDVFKNFNALNRDQQLLLGRSVWKYIIEKQGIDVVSGIMFIARYTHSAEAGISYYTKNQLSDFLTEWKLHYLTEFENKTQMVLPKGKAQIPPKINKLYISDIELNDNGQVLSLVTHDHGKFSVWICFLESGRVKKLHDGGLKVLNQINDCTFPKAKWKDNCLYLLTFEKGEYALLTFNLQGKILSKLTFNGFSAINDFALHPVKNKLIFSGVKNSYADIYSTSIEGGMFKQITHDSLFESNLIWLKNEELFYTAGTSNNIRNFYKKNTDSVSQLTRFEKPQSIQSTVMLNDTIICFLSDINGLQNAWFIGTKNHNIPLGLTNYSRSVMGQAISGDRSTFAELLKINNKNTIFTGTVNEDPFKEDTEVAPLNYINMWKGNLFVSFTDKRIKKTIVVKTTDTLTNTIGFSGPAYLYQTGFPQINYSSKIQNAEIKKPNKEIKTNLNPILPDFIVTQIDNKNLGTYLYDNSIPASLMRNPWLMPYFKVSLSDLQRNVNIEAGLRCNLDLTFNDFHFKSGFYAAQFDQEFTYHRRTRKYDNENNLFQQYTTQFSDYKIMLPVDERLRYSYTLGLRQDAVVTKITETQTAQVADKIHQFWTNKLEILFDNSVSSGLNQFNGSKVKLGLHYYLNTRKSVSLYWAEADLRFYIPLKQNITFAQRITGAYNLGRNKIGYYLGGVENWTDKNQLPDNPVFLNPENIGFQAWVCNLRGYYRGARMGHSYMLSNSELRFPVLKTIYRRPLASEFLKHFTIIAFADAGCAFTGNSPANVNNPYNTKLLNTPNYTMTITSRRNPWLLGFGYGIRSRILGYFVKFDRAYGWKEGQWEIPMQYLSLGLDF